MLAFYFLGVSLSNHLLPSRYVAFISPPTVRVKPRYPKWLQQFLQLHKHSILPVAEHICEDFSGVVVNGVPKPSLVFLAADITPHLIQFSTFNPLNLNNNAIRIRAFQQQIPVDRIEFRFFFLVH